MWLRATSAAAFIVLWNCGGTEFRGVEERPQVVASPAAPASPGIALPPTDDPTVPLAPAETSPPVAASAITWTDLRALNLRSGKASAKLERLNGAIVKLAGYMIPFSDEVETVSEFLLVPAAGLCVHKPAPPANQIVLVRMSTGTARVDWATAVEVTGAFHIDDADSPFGKASFRIAATSAEKW